MLKKIRANQNILSLGLLIILTCITQVFVLLKSSLVAGIFGTSVEMDAFNLANSITSFIYEILAAGIPTVIIPCYVKREPAKVVNTFLTIIYGVILIMSILIAALRINVVRCISNRDELFISITCSILIILLFAQFLSSITGIIAAFFQCEGKYNIPKVINLFSQIIVVIFLLLIKNISIYQYTFIIAGGLVFNFIFNLISAVKNGWRFRISLSIHDKRVKQLLINFLPIIFSSGVYRLTLFVDSLIASRLDEGMITVLSYSNQIAAMIDSILIGNLLVYAYPKIVKNIQSGVEQKVFWRQTVLFHSIVLLVVAGFYAVGNEGVSLLFCHGAFTEEAGFLVYCGALLYIVGQQTSTIINLIYRYFYSVGDTKTTAENSLIVSVLNVVFSLLFVKLIGFYGIILGTIVSSFCSFILILFRFKAKIGLDASLKEIVINYIKNIFLCFAVMAVIYFSKIIMPIDNRILAILLFGSETVIVYLLITFGFNKTVFKAIKEI